MNNKKKSLGSTPIGFNVNSASYSFIRDINARPQKQKIPESESEEEEKISIRLDQEQEGEPDAFKPYDEKEKTPEKKVVSYYLEVNLVQRLKNIADENGSYYSTLVSRALKAWLERHGHR